ncbi:NADH:flavin oxidoreductase [Roseovarius sp. TE539]|uniref:oxidoreductase n=1 Tax=Roseovarius sp. TE539 TaxID=2249812 RepID=UPI000DDC9FAE|nr:NAD(P)-binding protein [Roseovarius sp. TE539]RBI70365.1 NADH:flavin oxidoreductase [Roseovarius sp. TE539]
MTRDPRYDVLFEPVKIGPVTAKNRFYQVPHCTGMGYMRPRMLSEMRGIKAEGGWGVVCTEYNSIHPTSDDLPHPSASLWDQGDIRAHALMTEKVHEHGALAGAELWYGGARSANLLTREVSMDVTSMPNLAGHPYQTRSMDKADIRNLRRWHRKAALRARDAGFDIVYVYATHTYLLSNFLDPRANTRSDEYGGSLENRTRLVRELIEDTKEAVGDRCAVAVRFSADEEIGADGVPIHGERRDMLASMGDLPDLWDINIANYFVEMGVSRFTKEAALEPYMEFVKQVTSKPVVTVGRFTSPDTMVGQIRRGITDFIGGARPSIADPFLPAKIETGELGAIRECIGCNVCYSGDSTGVPIRCTQNPTMGEEWRKGWHPEKIPPRGSDATVLVVGAGPAGLEAARALGARGYKVMLAEARRDIGGRVTRESRLPGMSEYARVRDYRAQQMLEMPNVEVFLESRLSAEDVIAVGADHVAIATGATWRSDRFDGLAYVPVVPDDAETPEILTPDDIMDGRVPSGPVLVYDEDGYYMGGVIAEKLHDEGREVTLCTPSDVVSEWAGKTSERWRVRSHLVELGIGIELSHCLRCFDGSKATLACTYSGAEKAIAVGSVVMVTQRCPEDGLYQDILAKAGGAAENLPFTLTRIGDCEAPAIVAAAVHAGHRYAREMDEPVEIDEPLRHDRVDVGDTRDGAHLAGTSSTAPAEVADPGYLETLLRYYEEEIEGEAYFNALADRLRSPEQRAKMRLMAKVETHAAAAVLPLLRKYGLCPRPSADLHRTGRAQAAHGPAEWHGLIAEMRRTFPDYIDDFEKLESMAPRADLPVLKVLTAHEVAAIAFLEREVAADPKSTAPMRHYLATGTA